MTKATVETLMAAGLSKSMAYHVTNGVRQISIPLALWLYEQDGLKVGPLTDLTSREIRLLSQMHQANAPQSVVDRRLAKAA